MLQSTILQSCKDDNLCCSRTHASSEHASQGTGVVYNEKQPVPDLRGRLGGMCPPEEAVSALKKKLFSRII